MAKTRLRSPAHPAINLEQAINYAQTVYDAERRNLIPVSVAMEHMGYGNASSQGLRAVAALKQFGLMEEEGKKEDRQVRLTNLALDILIAPSEKSAERLRALRNAALEPTIHAELWQEYNEELPSDSALRAFLIRQRSFNDNYVDRFIREFRETIAYAGLPESDTISDDDTNDSEEDDESRHEKPSTRLNKNRPVSTDLKEDVFSLDMGAVIVQWPECIQGATKEDIEGWLKLVGSKLKRAIDSSPEPPDDEENAE